MFFLFSALIPSSVFFYQDQHLAVTLCVIMTGAVKLYYSVAPGQLTESRDVNTQLATPGVSFVGADDAYVVMVDAQSSSDITVSLIDDGVPRPTQVFLVNLTQVQLLSTSDNFAPRLGEP